MGTMINDVFVCRQMISGLYIPPIFIKGHGLLYSTIAVGVFLYAQKRCHKGILTSNDEYRVRES